MENTTPSTEPLDNITPKSDAELVPIFDTIYRDDAVSGSAVDEISELVPTTPENAEQVHDMRNELLGISDELLAPFTAPGEPITSYTAVIDDRIPLDVAAGSIDSEEGEEVLLDLDGTEGFECLDSSADGVEPILHSTADSTRMQQGVELFGITASVDPNADVTKEMEALSDDDKQRIQALREMAEAEHMTLTDAQLLAFLNRVKELGTVTKQLKGAVRQVSAKDKAKRRAAAKAAKASRKKNRR